MKYIHFTDEQKRQANSANLEDFLKLKGQKLIKSGREFRLESDKSITVRGNTWYDHSSEKGGYPIDFMKYFYNLNFTEAMEELLGNSQLRYEVKQEQKKELVVPQKNINNNRVFAYLTKHRGIDPSVLNFFIEKNLIYESKEYGNAVFVGVDNGSNISHIHKRSVNSYGKRFVQNIEGSSPEHSFNYLGGSDRLYVFESPIDLLSFISMNVGTNWKSHNYVALCGVSSKPMLYQINNKINHVVFCLDNDEAGQKATERLAKLIEERELTYSVIVPSNKDFNEDLVESLKPTERKIKMVMQWEM